MARDGTNCTRKIFLTAVLIQQSVGKAENAADKPKFYLGICGRFYGSSEQPVTEESLSGKDFLAGVVKAQERRNKKLISKSSQGECAHRNCS